ncbi:polysaccharide deacetylase family protein [Nocardia aobensis]|uniref:polysaccharide deacetylase family protein n=1 Tax=Nocardia aobensis TaxID=257277 RepID=UPI0002DA5BC0|nr:polysaccharide deacetylase family protein [Nocardia aobensis]
MKSAVAHVATAGAGAVLLNALPSVTAISTVRTRLTPGLSGHSETGTVALTFDDGPDPESTPAILDALAAARVHATFFLLGSMLERAPALGAEIVAAGHEVAVHGWSHRCLLARGPVSTYRDIARGYDLITEATGSRPRHYRPPYGILSAAALATARRLELTPVLWTACGKDWVRTATPDTVAHRVVRELRPGATVLLHDSDCTSASGACRATLGAIPRIVDECAERGLVVGSLAERTHTARHAPRSRTG